jgi:hypothetical protein
MLRGNDGINLAYDDLAATAGLTPLGHQFRESVQNTSQSFIRGETGLISMLERK